VKNSNKVAKATVHNGSHLRVLSRALSVLEWVAGPMLPGMSTTSMYSSQRGWSPMYHSLRRETIRVANSQSAIGVKSLRPTWFEDETVARVATEGSTAPMTPMHGLRLIFKEAPRAAKLRSPSRSSQAWPSWQLKRGKATGHTSASKPQ